MNYFSQSKAPIESKPQSKPDAAVAVAISISIAIIRWRRGEKANAQANS